MSILTRYALLILSCVGYLIVAWLIFGYAWWNIFGDGRYSVAECPRKDYQAASSNSQNSQEDLPPEVLSAFWGGDVLSLEVLAVRGGLSLSGRDRDGKTLLTRAVTLNDKELLRFLLKKGADPLTRNSDGTSPLATALKKKNLDAAVSLFAAGAHPFDREPDKSTPYDIAKAHAYPDLVALFETDCLGDRKESDPPANPNLALLIAIQNGDVDRALAALKNQANPNVQDLQGYTPLMDSILFLREPEKIVRALIDGGAEVDMHARDGSTALSFAVSRNKVELVKLLLAYGADPAKKIGGGLTVYDLADLTGDPAVLKALAAMLGKSPGLSHTDAFSVGTVQNMLAILGYNVGRADGSFGDLTKTAITLFQAKNNLPSDMRITPGLVKRLQSQKQVYAYYAAASGNWVRIKICERLGLNMDGRDASGWSPLLHAVNSGNRPLVEYLLRAGADANLVAGAAGEVTALNIALQKRDFEMVRSLLAIGKADPSKGSPPAAFIAGRLGGAFAQIIAPDYVR